MHLILFKSEADGLNVFPKPDPPLAFPILGIPCSQTVLEHRCARSFSGGGGKPSCPSPSPGDLRELPRVPLRGEGSCGGGGAARPRPAQSPGREAAMAWASLAQRFPASSVLAREGAGCGQGPGWAALGAPSEPPQSTTRAGILKEPAMGWCYVKHDTTWVNPCGPGSLTFQDCSSCAACGNTCLWHLF